MKQPTQEQFDNALRSVIDQFNKKASLLLDVPGIREILEEYYNDDVLDYLRYDYETNNIEEDEQHG